ncbi:MAG TPA: alpha/beta hydrolase [Paracoccaceae bacterium]|nr:alpha/beta hydrolase [Paracoccaceae bacterium]HMO73067.1 alpha/beta hydrolase [Paracoccaceae bacterium]
MSGAGEEAPLLHDLARGPSGGRAVWLRTRDGLRIRAAHWPGGTRGCVLLIPGRTEYIEKYGPAAADLAARGFSTLVIDNRGQGMADRLLPDPLMGHVGRFADYQLDLAALSDALPALGWPVPDVILGHSMGGAIGLRALIEAPGRFRAAVFSAPMWGIRMSPLMAPVARVVGAAARAARLGARYAPTTSPVPYPLAVGFDDNTLTTDREMWDFMHDQVKARPDLTLGGPSLHWLDAAMSETRWLARQPLPPVPALVALGSRERIVDTEAVRRLASRWPAARLMEVPGAEHEIMMEAPATRRAFYDAAAGVFGG